MATMASPYQAQKQTEAVTAHVLWMTTGLSCEGDSVAMTSAWRRVLMLRHMSTTIDAQQLPTRLTVPGAAAAPAGRAAQAASGPAQR